MEVDEISYSESMKLTTGTRFESKLVSFNAKAKLVEGEDINEATKKLKAFVREQIAEAIIRK